MSHDEPLAPNAGAAYSPDDGEFVRDEELLSSQTDNGSESLQPGVPHSLRRSSRVSARASAEVLVGRYQVERVISRSPREVLLQARHLDLGQRVLLRHLTLEASASPEAVQRFQRGARRAREMRSEHAERVVDFGRLESGAPYRATELPLGPSLAEVLRVRGSLPVLEAVDLVVTACEPVAEAHASGIIHRGLSPACIFIERRADSSPLVRVLDFGVSDPLEPDWMSQEDTLITSATMTASIPYASPEQIRNASSVDARSDVWALGAILYELLAGTPVFHADNAISLLAMIAADSPTPLNMLRADIPAELEEIVLACLEKDPERRPRSVVELAVALAQFGSMDAQPAAARVARIVSRTTRPPSLPGSTTGAFAAARTGMLVQTRKSRVTMPQAEPTRPLDSKLQSYTMLAIGTAIGVTAAVIVALATRASSPAPTAESPPKLRPVAAPVAAPATPPVPVAMAPVTSAVPVTAPAPAAPAPMAPVAVAAPVVAPAALAPAPAAAPALAHSPAPVARAVPQAKAPAAPRKAPARGAAVEAERPTASADAKDLFSGLE